jgi:tetratricopeptide (TPR) repeat protein
MPKHKKLSKNQVPPGQSVYKIGSAKPHAVALGAVFIVILTCIIYIPSISGGFIMDDDKLLTDNIIIKTSDGLKRFWCSTEALDYWPLTNTTLWIEWRLWELNPAGYHVTNLILHAIEALLIWLILRELSIPGAFLAALLFAVHPVNVESVAWISQRKNIMAMLFFLLSIFWYLKAAVSMPSNGITPERSPGKPQEREIGPAHSHGGSRERGARRRPQALGSWSPFYFLSLTAFVLAMLGKGSVAVLPIVLLGLIWWRRNRATKRDLLGIAPFFAASVVFTGINMWFQTHGSGEMVRNADFTQRLLGAGCVIWFYLYKAFFPVNLAFVYPQWHIRTGNPLWWLPLIGALAVTAALWRYRNKWSRPLLFAWGFFCVTLIPVMGFTDVGFMKYSLVTDHYLHIALIGAIALASADFNLWRKRTWGNIRVAAPVAAFLAVGTLSFLTWRQNALYRDPITLYQAALAKNPEFLMGHSNLGVELFLKGRFQEAVRHYEQAIRLKKDYPAAHNNLAIALVKLGQYQEAIGHFQQALQYQADYPMAEYNLGIALGKMGRLQEAINHYERAIRLKPDYTAVYFNLATSYANADKSSQAVAAAQKGLELARSQGLTAKAKQFEDWLKSHHFAPSERP